MSIDIEEILNESDYLLQASNLYSIYKGKGDAPNVVALRGLNIEIGKKEFVAAVGPSGSGKSTLLRCIGGLQKPSAGTIKVGSLDITKISEQELVTLRRNFVGFVFQSPTLIGSLSAFKNVVRTLQYAGMGYSESKNRAEELMQTLGIKSRMNALPSRMSGGERQRVGIAVALANKPKLILADEPTGNIDQTNTENVMGLFKDLHNDLSTSFFIVTHSKFVSNFADRNLELRDGTFLGEHRDSIDLDQLEESRRIIINKNGSLNLPPEMLGIIDTYGTSWGIRLQMDKGKAKIVLSSNGGDTSLGHSFDNCPVCKKQVSSTDVSCSNCGAQLLS